MKAKQKIKQASKKKIGFVVLLIAIIVGIVFIYFTKGGNNTISQTKIAKAQSLTLNSPVPTIPNLVIWYEPVLESSFEPAQTVNNAQISVWYNNAKSRSVGDTKLAGPAPIYLKSAINDLPAIHFDAGKTLAFRAMALNQKYYTIFIVENRGSDTGNLLSFGKNVFDYSLTNRLGNLVSGYINVANYDQANPTPRILTFSLGHEGRKVFSNGILGEVNGIKGPVNTNDFGFIGGSGYVGDIAEIIIYTSDLKTEDRNKVQEYLSKKYSIKVATGH